MAKKEELRNNTTETVGIVEPIEVVDVKEVSEKKQDCKNALEHIQDGSK